MIKLGQIENTTASLSEQLAANINKTGEIQQVIARNDSAIQTLNKTITTLKNKVDSQESQFADLQVIKKDFSATTEKAVTKMNNLIDTQREQVDSFYAGAKQLQVEWKRELMIEVNQKLEKMENARHYQSLKDQAFRNKQNLVIMGLPEDPEKSTLQVVKDYFSETLNIKNTKIISTLRLGQQSGLLNNYTRPILVKFGNWLGYNRRKYGQENQNYSRSTQGPKGRNPHAIQGG